MEKLRFIQHELMEFALAKSFKFLKLCAVITFTAICFLFLILTLGIIANEKALGQFVNITMVTLSLVAHYATLWMFWYKFQVENARSKNSIRDEDEPPTEIIDGLEPRRDPLNCSTLI